MKRLRCVNQSCKAFGVRWDPKVCSVCEKKLEGGLCPQCDKDPEAASRDPNCCPKCGHAGGPTPRLEERYPAEEEDELCRLPTHLMVMYSLYGSIRKEPETGDPDLWGSARGLLDELDVEDPIERRRALGYWRSIALAKGYVRAQQQEARERARDNGAGKG